MRRLLGMVTLVVGLLAAGCQTAPTEMATAPAKATTPTGRVATEAEPVGTGRCDAIDPSACLLPWPNDRFTRADPTTDTGRRLDLPADGTPANVGGTHIDPAEWNRSDGFAPASTLLTHIAELDVEASKLPPVTDIGRSLAKDSPLVLVDVGERIAAWAELDANAADPDRQALMIVPAAACSKGHRYAIGLRDLVHTGGGAVDPDQAFADQVAEHPTRVTRATFAALRRCRCRDRRARRRVVVHRGVERRHLRALALDVGPDERRGGRGRAAVHRRHRRAVGLGPHRAGHLRDAEVPHRRWGTGLVPGQWR